MSSSIPCTFLVLSIALALGACGEGNPPAAPTEVPTTSPDIPVAASTGGSVGSLQAYAATEVTPGGSCALDAINGAAADNTPAAAGSEVMFSGWIADATGQVPGEALLVLTGTESSYSTTLVAGGDRPDVAAALNSEAARMSGYNVLVALAAVDPGEYELSIVHGGLSCGLNKRLTIAAAPG